MVLALIGTSGEAAPESAGGPADVADQLRTAVDEAADEGASVQAMLVLEAMPDLGPVEGHRAAVVERLQQVARAAQDEVEVQLEQRREELGDLRVVNRFWMTNAMLVEFTADGQTLDVLASLDGVDRIVPNFEMTLIEPEQGDVTAADAGPYTWGLDKIGVGRVFDELGVRGEGIRVATLDTGVAIDHPDLAGKMMTIDPGDPTHPGGWMEFNSSGALVESNPHDSAYHGTHVSGTIHGGNTSGQAIGVAPEADMMHGLVIPGGSGSFAQVIAGMQWAIAPTDSDGNPAGEPADVVNMSLGAAGFHDEMITPTRNIRAAGVFPAFAIGNEDLFGNCGVGTDIGSSSPGNVYDAVGIGATDDTDAVAGFSCGEVLEASNWDDPPADWPDTYVKPDLSAPGVDVWSADPDGTYRYLSGTSMATPHTAGTVALMLSAAPELSPDQVEGTLDDTAVWDDRYADTPPDTRYGMGRIDAYEATALVAIDSGITGTVTEAGTSDPVTGATVAVADTDRSVVTGEDGSYQVRLEPGTYDIEVSAFGYEDATITGIVVTEESFTTADVALTPGPRGSIAGAVTFEETGEGVPGALVEVQGVPVDLSDVTDVSGAYAIGDVPVGTYTVTVQRDGFSEAPAQQVTVTEGETSQLDFVLTPPPQDVAVIGNYGDEYVDLLANYGIDADLYDWDQLAEVADYSSIITAYGFSSDNTQAEWDAFTAATDANGTGVVFTDHAFGTGQGIRKLSTFTGQPVDTGSSSGGFGADRSYYRVTQTHPILDGYAVGDELVLDDSDQSKWMAWFDDYFGDGREVLAEMGRDDATGIYGNGIAVQQRPTNRYVLLSSHGVSVTRGPADWTAEAEALFLNSLEWVTPSRDPGQPFFTVYDLQIDPQVVKSDEEVDISVDVKNVGASTGTYDTTLMINGEVEATTPVELDAGEAQEVSWTVSRYELGTYDVRVATETGSFRVRPPIVSLTAFEAQTGDVPAPGPLAGATVELVDDGDLLAVGETDADGQLDFEINAPSGDYTLVVRRVDDGDDYLLSRAISVADDMAVELRPRLLANPGEQRTVTDEDHLVTRVDLQLEAAARDHVAGTYLRPTMAAPHGFLYEPGRVFASVGDYELVHVHQVPRIERDWWLPSEVVTGIAWPDPFDQSLTFGGDARLAIDEVVHEAGEVTVDWDLADNYGNSFAVVLATELRDFVDLPDVLELEDVVGVVRGEAPNEGEVILRLQYRGQDIRAGGIGWDDRPYTFTMESDTTGRHNIVVEAETGEYSGNLQAVHGFTVR